jgi:hypothetical protein
VKFRRTIHASSGIGSPHKGEDGLWRLNDVPICTTGIEYDLSTGKHTFTESELAAAVLAADGQDIAINAPRIKLGHHSQANDLFLGEDEPAFGRVEGMKLSNNKQTVIGNYVGTPEWLAKVLPVAYPARSVDAQLGVETATGKRYEMVITDVSLLGIKWPGCSTLEDLPLWYGSDQPEGVVINAALDVKKIRQTFYRNGPGNDNKGWWIRGEKFDTASGFTLIVDEGTGDICRIPVTVEDDEVSFGDPVQVIEQFADKAVAAQAALAGMKMADPAIVIHASRSDTTEGEAMDEELRLSLAKRLGLADDATEEQIKDELAKPVGDPPAGDPPAGDPPVGDPPAGDPPAGDPPAGEETGTVTLDQAAYEELKAGAALARKHEGEQTTARVKETVEAAVMDGRIPPARREHWTKALEADFEGSKTVIDGLERGLVPLEARGSGGPGGEGDGMDQSDGAGLPEDWFPEIKTIRAQAASGGRVTNAKEG